MSLLLQERAPHALHDCGGPVALLPEEGTTTLREHVVPHYNRTIALEHCLSTLPKEQRIAIILRDVLGLDYAEIAQLIYTNDATVRTRLALGRAGLRERLKAGHLLQTFEEND